MHPTPRLTLRSFTVATAFVLLGGLTAVWASPELGQTTQTPPPQQGQTQQGQRGGQGQAGQGQTGQGQQGQGGRGGQQGQGQQGQNRDTTVQPTGTGTLTGSVVADDSGRPVRRVRVALTGGSLRAGKSATTDDQGHFTFTALLAGQFTLTASKAGYVTAVFGQKKPNRPGTPVQLAEGQKLDGLVMRIPHGGVITGRLLDEVGDPTPGTQVRVMRYDMRSGVKQFQQAGSDQTDDRGMYRIYGLPPGDYIVNAEPRVNLADIAQMVQNVADALGGAAGAGAGAGPGGRGGGGGLNAIVNAIGGAAGQGGRAGGAGGGRGVALLDFLNPAAPGDQPVGYAPVYYPGTTTSVGATTVPVGVGETREGIDFQLQLVPTAKVEGTVSSPDGDTQGIQVTLVNEQEQAMGMNVNSARVGPDGKFSFANIAPGQYTVMARGGGRGGRGGLVGQLAQVGTAAGAAGVAGGRGGRGGQPTEMLWGMTQVGVDGHDMSNVSITLQHGMTVSGHVTLEGTGTATGGAAAQGPPDVTRVRISLQSAETGAGAGAGGMANGPMVGQADSSGNFTITGIAPGKYFIRAQGAPNGFTAKSANAMGRDALDFPLEVKASQDVPGIAVTLSDKSTQLSGTLQDPNGQPTSDYTIIVFPAGRQYWIPQSRRIQSTRPGTSGIYSVRGLPAGDYRIAAVTDVDPGEWFDPAFLEQLFAASTLVSLGEGEKKTQDLRIGGGA
jgi:sarcosine oxidase gamma subunit